MSFSDKKVVAGSRICPESRLRSGRRRVVESEQLVAFPPHLFTPLVTAGRVGNAQDGSGIPREESKEDDCSLLRRWHKL